MSSDTTLIIGHLGRMGKRYGKILDSLGQKWEGYDIAQESCWEPKWTKFQRAIVATSTDMHHTEVIRCIEEDVKYVLCEKPLSLYLECAYAVREWLNKFGHTDFRIVCNWSYVLPWRLKPNSHDVVYGNWHTGSDGLHWDCCQLHYLDSGRSATISPKSCNFMCGIDNWDISLTDIDRSYYAMLKDWYEDPTRLWGIDDAIAMEEKVEKICARG